MFLYAVLICFISQFAKEIQNLVMFMLGMYGIILFGNHYMSEVLESFWKMAPNEMIEIVSDSFDCNDYFFGH